MESQEIRKRFLRYFKEREHNVVTSSPVVPHDDPTLLFNNAGMNQFKDVFLGNTVRDYTRAASAQKCIRVGGKHNDLDNVGHTSRHLTLFEMLGNFSFGDYYKKQAIQYAWEVSTDIIGFDIEKLWATIYLDDDESFELWKTYLPENRIVRLGKKDNFWAMGDIGPCGPCSELHYDRGDLYSDATSPLDDPTGERFLEFWNLVFMESNQLPDGTLVKLPKPSIDTGAGLERVVGLKMGVENVFETDILKALIDQVSRIANVTYDKKNTSLAPAFHVIADHLRCLAFAIADGAQPSNVDRGYVLRKVLRRAVRYGRTLGIEKPFLADVLPRLIETMGDDYPEIKIAKTRIADLLTMEEEGFLRTLKRGGNMLSQITEHAEKHDKIISGDEAFKLKDTYGFPVEEILLIAKDASLQVDLDRYHALEREAKERSRKVHKTTEQVATESLFSDHGPSEFLGYTSQSSEAKVTALVVDGELVDTMNQEDEGMVILDRTPFYAEMGGQVGDKGTLKSERHHFTVHDTQSPFKGVIAHVGKLEEGTLNIGDTITATINVKRRQRISNNHTATHLLHWALSRVLGEHIKQAGSVVDDKRLRFDFSHHKAVTQEEIHEIEDLVNRQLRLNLPVKPYELSYEEAQTMSDIKQFFGEKYGKVVRVVDIDFCKELCGGTHTSDLGTIGLFRITKESSIAAGIRRIEAVTGAEAEHFARHAELQLGELANTLKTNPKKLKERVEKLLEERDRILGELKEVKQADRQKQVEKLLTQVEQINGTPLLVLEVSLPPAELAPFADKALETMHTGVVILATANHDKCHILARVSDDLVSKGHNAGQLIKELAPIIEGKGGGKATNAQAGGTAPNKIGDALAKARTLF